MMRHASGSNNVIDKLIRTPMLLTLDFLFKWNMIINYTTNISTLASECHKSERNLGEIVVVISAYE